MDMGPGLIKEGLLKTRGYGKMGTQYLHPSKRTRPSARCLFTKSRSKPQVYYSVGKPECAPSQNGPFAECLQLQKATFLGSVISTFCGTRFVPWWDPSQNGCLEDFPHEHHQYSPGSRFITAGMRDAITGFSSDMITYSPISSEWSEYRTAST